MKRNLIVLLTILVCGLTACKPGQKKEEDMEKETKLKIETSAGDITVKLYNETPKHRDNFIKLVEDGTYEGTLFHRVIKDFMIQAGDPESKKAPKGKMLGRRRGLYRSCRICLSEVFSQKRCFVGCTPG